MRFLLVLLFALPLSAQTPARNYFFGDSLSDTGNIASILGTLGPGYPQGSFTNGPTWVKYFDSSTKLLLESLSAESQFVDLDGSVDLSAGGATTAASALENLTNSVAALDASGLPNIAIISQTNLGLSPRGAGLREQGASIIN
ncbi:hypothetical protein N9044_02165, partial [bacterium]|nr:hypothetical protein [bacterium]